MRDAALEPLDPYPGNVAPWRCTCIKCGNVVSPTRANIQAGQGGCQYCSKHGLHPGEPADIYVLHHPEYGAHKVGVTVVGSKRLTLFSRDGWQVFRTMRVARGDEARRIEASVLAGFRDAGHSPFLSAAELPNGFTETIDAEAVSLPALWDEILAAALSEASARKPNPGA